MERLRPITVASASALVALTLAAVGCVSTDKPLKEYVDTTVHRVRTMHAPDPATRLICSWQPQLVRLPDPTQDGSTRQALVGQIYLLTARENAAVVAGDLTVAMYDDTVRPPGSVMKDAEVVHIDSETLRRLVTNHDWFGRCYMVVMNWPDDWTDVTKVKIMARYDPAEGPTLHASEVRLAVDRQSEGKGLWTEVGHNEGGNRHPVVPAGAKVLQNGLTPKPNSTAPAQSQLPQATPQQLPATVPNVLPQAVPIQSNPAPAPQLGDFQPVSLQPTSGQDGPLFREPVLP